MNIFQKIGNAIKSFFNSKPVVAVEDLLKQAWDYELQNLWKQLGSLALIEVGVLMNSTALGGSDKAAVVRGKLTDAAKTAGINLGVSSANILVETAYQYLKKNQDGNGGVVNSNAGITVNGQPAPVNKQGNVNG